GQKFFDSRETDIDESGNIRLKDIGLFLKNAILTHFRAKNIEVTVKYIDPSYMIRSLPANANDHLFCSFLGRDAVHAGMAGKTELIIGNWNNAFVHIPLSASAGRRKQVNPKGKLWLSVLQATGQYSWQNKPAVSRVM
ncbi:MAG: ATP-dependent 6-phosphofructokinase, partial [Desulfobacterales bacterium]